MSAPQEPIRADAAADEMPFGLPPGSPAAPPVAEEDAVPPANSELPGGPVPRMLHPDLVAAEKLREAVANDPEGACVPLEPAPLPNNTIRADDIPPGFDLQAALREIEERRAREAAAGGN